MKTQKIKVEIPNGIKATIDVPDTLDLNLTTITIKSFLGGLVAIDKVTEAEDKKDFLLRYAASIINDARHALIASEMRERFSSIEPEKNSAKIVEDFLKSLHPPKGK